jgi:nitrite reductase/ring-hydroxylating ferredoxin subunit
MHIVCPWHGYEFHLKTGEHVANNNVRLQKFAVTEREGKIYVTV